MSDDNLNPFMKARKKSKNLGGLGGLKKKTSSKVKKPFDNAKSKFTSALAKKIML